MMSASSTAAGDLAPYVLPRRASLKDGESLASLIVRNAETFRFRDPVRILRRIRPPGQKLNTIVCESPTPEFRVALAALLGLDALELDRISYPTDEASRIRFAGHEIPRDFLTLGRRRYCPRCLLEDAFHRMAWDLTIVTVCPWHALPLLEKCPGCGKTLKWRTNSLTRCPDRRCGADLRKAAMDPITDGRMAGVVATLDALFGSTPDGGPPGLPSGHLVRLAFHLGAFARGYVRFGRATEIARRHANEMHLVMEEGWAALADWPHGFHALLRSLRSKAAERRGRYGLRKEFGYLTHWLILFGAEPWCKPVAEEFASFVAGQTDLATKAISLQRYASLEALRHRHMTLGEAARFLGVAPETMSDLAARENLFLVPPSGPGAPSLLRADRIKALRDAKAATLMKQEAERLLAVSRHVLRDLEALGLLPTVPHSERITYQRLYRRSDIERLISRLEAAVLPGSHQLKRTDALPDAGRGVRTVGALCIALLEGRLRAAAVDQDACGLRRIRLDPVMVAEKLPVRRETLSVVQCAKEMGVAAETMRLWVNIGFLESSLLGLQKERGRRITQQALDRFRRDYATAGVIADETGVGSGRWAAERLRHLGVRPVSGPSLDDGQTYLFRRADLSPAVWNRLRVSGHGKARASKSTKGAFDMAAAVARRAEATMGRALHRRWNGFRDADGSVFVQALTGRRTRFMSKYVFRFNSRNTVRLEATEQAWVAFAFLGQDFFLLVPWEEVRPLLDASKIDRRPIMITVDGAGRVGMFSEYRHLL